MKAPGPISASASTTAQGPIQALGSTRALASTTALGWRPWAAAGVG